MGFRINRSIVERAVQKANVGYTTDNRNFLKDKTTAPVLQVQKSYQRCCTLDKSKLAQDAVDSLLESKS